MVRARRFANAAFPPATPLAQTVNFDVQTTAAAGVGVGAIVGFSANYSGSNTTTFASIVGGQNIAADARGFLSFRVAINISAQTERLKISHMANYHNCSRQLCG